MAANVNSSNSMQLEDHVFTKTVRQQMVQLRKAKQHTDVILKADGVELHCHQVALSAGSGYFNAMFASDCTESNDGIVEIIDISPGTLESVIDYIYTGEIQITIENAQRLVQASDLYHLDTLKKTCEPFMVDHLEAQNCLGFYRFAQMYRLNDLTKESRDYMLSHFKDCVLGPEFKELTDEELVKYIKDDHLNVKDEDVVFEAVLVWVKHDAERRGNKLLSILQHLRVYYCSDWYLSHLVEDDIVAKDPSAVKFVHQAQKSHTMLASVDLMPRHSYPAKRCLVIVGGTGKAGELIADQRCSYFDEESKSWRRLASLPSPGNKYFSVCKFRKKILMTGGMERMNSCWILDTARKEWKQLPNLVTGRFFHGSIQHGDRAYVIGGTTDNEVTSSVEIFCGIKEVWLTTEPLMTAVKFPIVASHGRCVYCFGGLTAVEEADKDSRQTQVYDAVWESWSERAQMPQTCRCGSAVSFDEYIFVLGGYSKSCMSYSPDIDQWSLLAQPNALHGHAPAIVWHGKILVFGGFKTDIIPTSLIEEYDPDTDTWETWGCSLEREHGGHYLFDIDIPALKQ